MRFLKEITTNKVYKNSAQCPEMRNSAKSGKDQ